MKQKISQRLKNSQIGSIITLSLGIMLLVYMITIEDEPGALPLFFILVGTVWLIITQYQIKRNRKAY